MSETSASAGSPFATARRREIARACSFGARTADDVARQLGTERGSITTVLSSLVAEGVLRETSASHTTGRAYELVQNWRPALTEAIGSDAPLGQIIPGGRLLVVGSRDPAALQRVIAAIAADPIVVWAARLDGPARLLVSARAVTSEEREQVDRLEALIAGEGVECVQLRIDRVMELPELEKYARTLKRRPVTPELSPPRRLPGQA